jgi:hypothetical protein
VFDEQMIDLLLWRVLRAADLANVNSIGRGLNVSEQFGVN